VIRTYANNFDNTEKPDIGLCIL